MIAPDYPAKVNATVPKLQPRRASADNDDVVKGRLGKWLGRRVLPMVYVCIRTTLVGHDHPSLDLSFTPGSAVVPPPRRYRPLL
jgi:hypothetical protein